MRENQGDQLTDYLAGFYDNWLHETSSRMMTMRISGVQRSSEVDTAENARPKKRKAGSPMGSIPKRKKSV